MSGIVGVVNFEKDISDLQCIKKMSLTLKRRGKKDEYYFSKNTALSVRGNDDNNVLMTFKIDDITYVIVMDGEIYNNKEILEKLREWFCIQNRFGFRTLFKSLCLLWERCM